MILDTLSSVARNRISLSSDRYQRIQRLWYRFSSNQLSVIGAIMILIVIGIAVFAPYIAPFPKEGAGGAVNIQNAYASPSAENLMGTDSTGRDIFSRVMFGARISLQMAAIVLTLSVTVGVIMGLTAGYLGGKINTVIMRIADTFMSIRALLLAMVVAAILGPSIYNAALAISAYWWTEYARITEGQVKRIKQEEFVESHRALGANWWRTASREVLPNITSPILVKSTLDAGYIILVSASLGFVGLGTQPPNPDWGVMVALGRQSIGQAWWISTMPGFAIAFTVLGFNLLGDGLRDVFDVEEEI